ncbi:MAG: hypothetical protein Q9170_008103, partial [Blastenia crenularia]
MFLFESLLCCFYLAILAVAPLPPPASPGTDACGPFDHTGDAGFSTCTSSVVPGGPSPYGIVCGKDSSVTVSIKIDSCAKRAQDMCYKLADGKLNAGEWHWSYDLDRPSCRMGVYLSPEAGAAPLPNYRRCLNQIYQPMVMSCVNAKYNVATVNIKALPDYTANNPGLTVNPGYHAFIVSPMALYYSTNPLATPGVFGSPVDGVESVWDKNYTGYPGDGSYNAIQRAAALA